jgi:hypothetical protein
LGGRSLALADLDRLVAVAKNREALRDKMQEAIDKDPLGFFRTYVMPLLPKEGKVEVAHDGIVEWKSLLGDEPGEKPRFDEKGLPIPGR